MELSKAYDILIMFDQKSYIDIFYYTCIWGKYLRFNLIIKKCTTFKTVPWTVVYLYIHPLHGTLHVSRVRSPLIAVSIRYVSVGIEDEPECESTMFIKTNN